MSKPETTETPAPPPPCAPCGRCGCHSRTDEVGDRTCWCDACWHGCTDVDESEHEPLPLPRFPCARCGCFNRTDEVGDRVCWCDACWHGCCTPEENEEYAAGHADDDWCCEHCDGRHPDWDEPDHDDGPEEDEEDHRTVFGDCPGCYPGCFGCQRDFNPADPWGDGAPEEHPGHPGYCGPDSDDEGGHF